MSDARLSHLLRHLRDQSRPAMLAAGWPSNTCVAATRVIVGVLDQLGVPADSISVQVVALDRECNVVARLGAPGGGVLRNAGWAGHVVAVVDDYIVDLTLDQIPGGAPTVVAFPGGLRPGDERSVIVGALEVVYNPLPGDRSFAACPDWQAAPGSPVDKMINEVAARLRSFGHVSRDGEESAAQR